MEKEFTPQQSFDLINTVIDKRRMVYEENGTNIFLWGLAVMFAGIGQFVLIHSEWANMSGLIWFFTMIPMFIYTVAISIYNGKKKQGRNKSRSEWDVSGMSWFLAGSMAMLNGFVFREFYGVGFTTVMFLPFGIAALVTALSLKNIQFVWLTLLATVVAFSGLYVPFMYHPLISALIAFLMFFLPGLSLRSDFKRRQNV
jgi:hypothetical protein